ncbi:hypothetical protein [Terriglobus sp.]|uniref:hypothetical protein n=1 Tax=Terriglobus sp. TaxID=1889013 RepID=UPI003B00AB51
MGAATCFWNGNAQLAAALLVSAVGLVLWTLARPRPPGISIGFAALVAGIMSVRSQMKPQEKFVWIVVLVALVYSETRAIQRSDETNQRNQEQQKKEFAGIAADLRDSIRKGEEQYSSTIRHVDVVLSKTTAVATLAQTSLDDITGKDSFLTVIPDVAYSGDDITFKVVNRGRHIVSGSSLLITKLGVWWPGVRDIMLNDVNQRIQLPVMHPGETLLLSRHINLSRDAFGRELHESEKASVYVFASGPSLSAVEQIDFRRNGRDSAGRPSWQFRYDVVEDPPYQIFKPGQKVPKTTRLEHCDWTTESDPKHPVQPLIALMQARATQKQEQR